MSAKDRRRDVRIETKNLISHDSINDKGKIVSSSMGKALNISRSGILLESPHPIITTDSVSLTTVDIDNNLIEIKGKPIYCRLSQSGMYRVGIKFIGAEKETSAFAVKLIKLHHYRKHNLVMRIAA